MPKALSTFVRRCATVGLHCGIDSVIVKLNDATP